MATATKPWERLDGEGPKAYEAFVVYRSMGPQRSLSALTRRLKVRPGSDQGSTSPPPPAEINAKLAHWSAKYHWVARCRQWDEHLASRHDRGIEKAVESEAERLVKLRERSNAETLAFASSLKIRAAEMLGRPLDVVTRESSRTSEDGYTTNIFQTVEPAKWMQRDIVTYVRAARELEEVVLFPERKGQQQQRGPVDSAVSEDERNGSGPAPTPEELVACQSRYEEWKAEVRERMLQFPDRPPGAPEDWSAGGPGLVGLGGVGEGTVEPLADAPAEGDAPKPPRSGWLGNGRQPHGRDSEF